MLQDAPIQEVSGDRSRRWMADDYFDLIVWYEPDQSVHGFQLCYDKRGEERAVTWTRIKGFQFSRVDSGESCPTDHSAPILIPGGTFPSGSVREEFLHRSALISPEIRNLVLSKLGTMR